MSKENNDSCGGCMGGANVPYIASFRGPILLSAPHSTKIQRGGALSKTKERIHLREQWVSTLVLKLAIAIEQLTTNNTNYKKALKASVLFWSKDKKYNKHTLDPNYLVKQQFKDSPFH